MKYYTVGSNPSLSVRTNSKTFADMMEMVDMSGLGFDE